MLQVTEQPAGQSWPFQETFAAYKTHVFDAYYAQLEAVLKENGPLPEDLNSLKVPTLKAYAKAYDIRHSYKMRVSDVFLILVQLDCSLMVCCALQKAELVAALQTATSS